MTFPLTVDGSAGTLVWHIVWEYFYQIALNFKVQKICLFLSCIDLKHPILLVLVEIIALTF